MINIKCYHVKRIFRRIYVCLTVEEVFTGSDEISKNTVSSYFMHICSICKFYSDILTVAGKFLMASLKQMLVLFAMLFGCLEYGIKNNHFIMSVDKDNTVSKISVCHHWVFTLLLLLRMQK